MSSSVTLSKSQTSSLKKMRQYAGVEDLSADPVATMAVLDAHYKTLDSTITVLTVLKKLWPDVKLFAQESKARSKASIERRNLQIPSEAAVAKEVNWMNVIMWRNDHFAELNQQEQLLLGLYTMQPPARLDYTPMRIVTRKPTTLEPLTNYLVWKKDPYFLFHSFKTHDVYGDITEPVRWDLEAVLKDWIDTHPGQLYLLEDAGVPWTDNRLGKAVQSIFRNYHGLSTGVSALRHAYLTNMYAGMPSIVILKEMARSMMHSPSTSQQYRHL
jgi:hypothetical protein